MYAKDLDYVRTKSGRTGTIVHEYFNPELAYEIEYDNQDDTETIEVDEIVEIIASYGEPRMKVRFIGEGSPMTLTTGKIYEVLNVEHDCYRIIDEIGEDYLYYVGNFEIIE